METHPRAGQHKAVGPQWLFFLLYCPPTPVPIPVILDCWLISPYGLIEKEQLIKQLLDAGVCLNAHCGPIRKELKAQSVASRDPRVLLALAKVL